VFFGHSMGAYVAFELARRLERDGMRPEKLVLSGAGAPHARAAAPIAHLPGKAFLSAVIQLGGMPAELAGSADMLAYLLPILRADFMACEQYQPAPGPALDMPLSVIGGDRDHRVGLDQLDAWRVHAGLSFGIETMPGGHFFLHHHRERVLGRIFQDLGIPSL
jgi:surfactin synthase thioesterase subunit